MSTIVYREQPNSIRISNFRSATESAIYSGSSLTNMSVEAILYDDTGTPSSWSIADTLSYASGSSWVLNLTASESDQTEEYATLFVSADEIEPYQLDIDIQDYLGNAVKKTYVSVSVGI